jgi:periplasmic protein TonB
MNKPFATPFIGLAATLLALSLPSAALAQATPKVLKKVPMDFPGEAVRRGVDKGVLKTRITVDGEGAVTAVDVVDVQPGKAKILNESVIAAVGKWRFEGSGKPNTFEMQVVLTAD